MIHCAGLFECDNPLIVSLKPFKFHWMVPALVSLEPPTITTLPLPNPFGIHSLVPLRKILAAATRPFIVVVPVQSLDGLDKQTVPVTVAGEHKPRLKGPEILPEIRPPDPPLPPSVVSPINVHGP